MKHLGIDYGAKKIGIALSDDRGAVAFPKNVIPNDEHAVAALANLAAEEKAESMVMGDTRTESGKENEVTAELADFVEKLEQAAGVPITLVGEQGTSAAARSMGDGDVDARAAALILQRFLDANQPVVE